MQKGVALIVAVAGVTLFAHRPLTQSELDTARIRLQAKIEVVDKKIDRLSAQVQALSQKMDRLDGRFVMLEKHLDLSQESKSDQAVDKTVPAKPREPIEKTPTESRIVR